MIITSLTLKYIQEQYLEAKMRQAQYLTGTEDEAFCDGRSSAFQEVLDILGAEDE